MKRGIYFFLIISVALGFCIGFADEGLKSDGSTKETKELIKKEPERIKAEEVPYIIIEGYLIIRSGHLYLKESGKGQKLYRITGKENVQVYSSLLSLAKEKLKENKGVKAVIWGKVGRFAQITEEDIRYTESGQPKSRESRSINFAEFDIIRIDKTYDVPLKDIEKIKITSPEYMPMPLARIPQVKRIQGEVIGAYFNKVIPYIKIQDQTIKKPKVIIIPSNIKVLKVMEGQLMGFSPKGTIKPGVKLEVWYEEIGDINTAQTISILSEQK